MLHLFHAASPQNLEQSDAICTGLQLVNFWQDVRLDWHKHRVYLPQEDLRRHGVSDEDGRRPADARRRELMAFRWSARALLHFGAPLARRLPGRIGLELRMVVQGGLRVLERIEAGGYDVFMNRPELGARTGPSCCGAPSSKQQDKQQAPPNMTPDEYCRDKAAKSGSSLLLVPVPAARAPPRDHRAVRFLPRGRRRGRRVHRPLAGPRQAGLVAHPDRPDVRRQARAPGDARAAPAELFDHARAAAGGGRRHGNGPGPDPLPDWPGLRKYCWHAAGVVGELSAGVFGYSDPRTLVYAEKLGLAFQMTNIIRDVGDDARRGRISSRSTTCSSSRSRPRTSSMANTPSASRR